MCEHYSRREARVTATNNHNIPFAFLTDSSHDIKIAIPLQKVVRKYHILYPLFKTWEPLVIVWIEALRTLFEITMAFDRNET